MCPKSGERIYHRYDALDYRKYHTGCHRDTRVRKGVREEKIVRCAAENIRDIEYRLKPLNVCCNDMQKVQHDNDSAGDHRGNDKRAFRHIAQKEHSEKGEGDGNE